MISRRSLYEKTSTRVTIDPLVDTTYMNNGVETAYNNCCKVYARYDGAVKATFFKVYTRQYRNGQGWTNWGVSGISGDFYSGNIYNYETTLSRSSVSSSDWYQIQISFTNIFGEFFSDIINVIMDYEGNVYNCIQYGNQLWTVENLRSTKYTDGSDIAVGGSSSSITTGYYYEYPDPDDPTKSLVSEHPLFGRLYNHAAVETNKLAPAGFRVPTKEDFEYLMMLKGNHASDYAGSRLIKRVTGTDEVDSVYKWNASSVGYAPGNYNQANRGVNEFGAIPAGERHHSSGFQMLNNRSTFRMQGDWFGYFYYRGSNFQIYSGGYDYTKKMAYAIRCCKDLDPTDYLCFTSTGSSTIAMTNYGTNATTTTPSLQYSFDKATWYDWVSDGAHFSTISLADGKKVWFRGTNSRISRSTSNYSKFNISGNVKASGDLTTILDPAGNVTNLTGKDYCFYSLFNSCSIRTASSLPATILSDGCYMCMFMGCTSLTSAPSLPATTLTSSCYTQMYYGCTSLTSAPSLPATTLALGCYYYMFYGCTSLTSAPSLPATTLALNCYGNMFEGCSSLTLAPELLATTLVSGCYVEMFQNCTSLTSITIYATSWNTSFATNWVYNVAPSGTFYNLGEATNIPIDNVSGVPVGWTVLPSYLCFTANTASTVSMTNNGNNIENYPTLHYSYDKSNWYEWIPFIDDDYFPELSLSAGQSLYFYGTNDHISSSDFDFSAFTITGSVAASGDITSLLRKSGGVTDLTGKPYCFYELFGACPITTPPILPSTTLDIFCYSNMFAFSSIASAPALPATNLASNCYNMMFNNCTSLTSAPALPATTLAEECYAQMFYGCTNLITPPSILPAMTLTDVCYGGMFMGCSNLASAPSLPATTLAEACYSGMFYACTSLTAAPALPATTLVDTCYNSMFMFCTNLTAAPLLPAETLVTNCYTEMFYECSSLNSVTTYATAWDVTCASEWLTNVASSGTFTKPAHTTIPTGISGIPTNWTVNNIRDYLCITANEASVSVNLTFNNGKVLYSTDAINFSNYTSGTYLTLSNIQDKVYFYSDCNAYNNYAFTANKKVSASGDITTLLQRNGKVLDISHIKDCFKCMFKGCNKLQTIPSLPSTTLSIGCYCEMFKDCSDLSHSGVLPATTLVENCYTNMFLNCSNLKYVHVLTTSWNTEYTKNWLSGVSTSGTFTKPTALQIGTGSGQIPINASGIPANWSITNI